jgi:hypothetical protein
VVEVGHGELDSTGPPFTTSAGGPSGTAPHPGSPCAPLRNRGPAFSRRSSTTGCCPPT